jgi:hypothetical protein
MSASRLVRALTAVVVEPGWSRFCLSALGSRRPALCVFFRCTGWLSGMLCGMWRERISGWTGGASFHQGASEAAVRACEAALDQRLPADLVGLLRESNGVDGEYGLGLVWPVERIQADNLRFRTDATFAGLYMPFEPLLFFADAGNGDQFAFVMRDRPADVFVWDHETDSRTMVAPSLATYLQWWLDGRINT